MSRTLQALQNQAEGLQDRREEIQQRINNFDLEKEMYNGASTAYNLGKASLSTAIGGERVQALELSAPLGIKGLKYLSARSGLTQAISDKYKAFRGSNIGKTVEDLKSRGQSAIDEATENLGGGEGFSVENLSSAADKLANTSAEDVAQGVFKNGFTTTRLGGIGNNLTQEVRQIGSGAYRNMTDDMKAALPKGTVDEDGIPYSPEYLSNDNIRAGLQTGRFNIEGGQIKDSIGETPDFGAEPELLSDVGNVATGLRGGAPFSKAYGGLTRGSETPSSLVARQPQRTQRGLFDEQGNIDTSKLGDPYDERVGLGTEPEVSQASDFGRISQSLAREEEAQSFQPGRSTLGDVFRQDARITSSQATDSLEPVSRVAPPQIEAARQQRLQEFREAGQTPPEEAGAAEEASPFQQALQRASQIRPTPSQQARAPGSSKGKAPAREPEPEVSEELGGSAEALEERLPASTGTTRTIDPETALADRPRGAYGTSQGRAQQRLAQPDPEPSRAEPEISDEPLQQPRTITQNVERIAPSEESKEDAAVEETTGESGITKATNVADAKEVAEESETLGGDLAKETGLDAIAEEGGEAAAEEGGAALVPGFGELAMAGIGAYQLIKSASQSKQEESIKPPAQPQMPQGLGGGVAFDSAPVIDSSDYHNL